MVELLHKTNAIFWTWKPYNIYRMHLNSHYRLWGRVVGTKKVTFCIGTHVQKHTASLLQIKYHHATCWTPPLLLLTVHCFSSGSNLTLPDYFLWGHMKSLIYETPVESEKDLLAWFMTAAVGLPGIGVYVYIGGFGACQHLRSLAPIMNDDWWYWWPNDIQGPWGGPKASWYLSYGWEKTSSRPGIEPGPTVW